MSDNRLSLAALAFLILAMTSSHHCVTSKSLGHVVNLDDPNTMSGAEGSSGPLGDHPLYTGDSANVSRLLDQLMRGYDKRLRPNYKGGPVEVGITMFVSSVSSISEANMDFTLDFYFRQHWHDPRLQFTEDEEELCISNEMLSKIWWPDTFFANAKSASFHTATTKNAFLRIKPTGWITLSLRLTVTSTCSMDLTYFPMDTQVCSLEIESYAYSVKHISYKWKDGPQESVKLDRNVQLPQVKVRGYRVRDRMEVLTTGNYSRLACQFYFVRSLGYYVIQVYIPSSLIVVLSWVSFWLHRDAAPARVALGITTILTMTTLISSTNTALPKISYLKSIDVYLVTCFVMVFASIVEYAAVSYIGSVRGMTSPTAKARLQQPRRRHKQQQQQQGHVTENGGGGGGDSSSGAKQTTSVYDVSGATKAPRHLAMEKTEAFPIFGQNKLTPDAAAKFPVQTEVRLTSMRKLYTECDLRYLSVTGCTTGFVSVTPCTGSRMVASGPATPLSNTTPLFNSVAHHVTTDGKDTTAGRGGRPPSFSSSAASPSSSSSSSSSPSDNVTLANAIDRYARILFPVSFCVLSAIYWVVYIQISPRDVDQEFVFID